MRTIALTLLLTASLDAQTAVPFDPARWDIAPSVRSEGLGTDTLSLRGGEAFVKDVTMADGILEVDVLPRKPAYAGFVFRATNKEELELVYIRPQRSGYADATQYTPRYNGLDSWQLYSGEGNIATADFFIDKPSHLKLVFLGPTAQLFVNDKLALTVARLQHPYTRGAIGLSGLANSSFMNFKYQELPAPEVTALPPEPVAPNTIQCWELSQNFNPGADLNAIQWQRVTTLPSGLLDISRYRKHRYLAFFADKRYDEVVARTTIRSAKRQTTQLDFAYSDTAEVFVNGKPVYRGDLSFLSRDPFFLGILSLGHDAIFAELNEGANEIRIVSTEWFGGWGLQLRVHDPSGITLPECSRPSTADASTPAK